MSDGDCSCHRAEQRRVTLFSLFLPVTMWQSLMQRLRTFDLPKSMAASCHSAWSRRACAAFRAGHLEREVSHQHGSKWRSRFDLRADASAYAVTPMLAMRDAY